MADLNIRARIALIAGDAIRDLDRLGDRIAGVGKAAVLGGAAVGAAALGALAIAAAKNNAEFQKLQVQLDVATGSAANAGAAFTALQTLAAKTPFSVKQLTEAFVTLKNLGLDPSEAALISYGNTASAMGKTLDQFVQAVGDAVTGEFERLKEFGIKASAEGERVAFTFKGVTTRVGNNAREIETFLQNIGNVDFAGGMEKQAQTLGGQFSNLGDNVDRLLSKFGDGGFDAALGDALTAMNNAAGGADELAAQLGGLAGDAIGAGTDISSVFDGIVADAANLVADVRVSLAGLSSILGDVFVPFGVAAEQVFDVVSNVFDALGLKAIGFADSLRGTLREIDAINNFAADFLGTARTNFAGNFDTNTSAKAAEITAAKEGRDLDRVLAVEEAKRGGDRLARFRTEAAAASASSAEIKKAAAEQARAIKAAKSEEEAAFKKAREEIEAFNKLPAALIRTIANTQVPTGLVFGDTVRDQKASVASDTLSASISAVDERFAAAGKKAGDAFSSEALRDAAAIGQAIGGPLGRVIASLAGLGRGTVGADGITRDATGTGKQLTQLLAPLGDVFGAGGKKFAGLVGQAAGGAATGSLVSGIGDALGIKNSKAGAQIGGAIGSFIPIPGGEIIGSILGGLLPGLFGSKPKGSTTISGSGGQISQSSTGNANIQKATGGLGNTITDALQSIADQLGATIGDFSVSIGKEGDRFRVDTTGQGRTKKNNSTVIGFDTDEGAAVAAALADALKDGAIVASPRVQAALTAYGDNVNKAVAEALKVKGLEELLADRGNPFLGVFRGLEQQLRQRTDVARKYGFDLVEIERINGEDRAAALKDALAQATGSVRSLLDDFRFGSRATGSASERLAGLTAERDRVAGLVRGGDTGQLDVLAGIVQQLDDLGRETFGSTKGFADGRADSVSLLNDLVKQTEDRIKAAAEQAQAATATTNAKLTEANASLDDLVAGQAETNRRLDAVAAAIAGSFGGGGGGFGLTSQFAR